MSGFDGLVTGAPASRPRPGALEQLAKRDRPIVLLALAGVVVLSIVGLDWTNATIMSPWAPPKWSVTYTLLLLLMWWLMMLAMMLPSAAAAILIFATLSRRLNKEQAGYRLPAAFALGYALVWTAFSGAAVAAQMLLSLALPLTGMMAVTSRWLGGGLLIAAGLYQLTPLKVSCLNRCQSPLMFFARHWRPRPFGALRMGIDHGLSCVGCCSMLMGLLFYGGVMEPAWIAGLAMYVLAEKLIPARLYMRQITAGALLLWGWVELWFAAQA